MQACTTFPTLQLGCTAIANDDRRMNMESTVLILKRNEVIFSEGDKSDYDV